MTINPNAGFAPHIYLLYIDARTCKAIGKEKNRTLQQSHPDTLSEYTRNTIVSMETKHNTRLTVNSCSCSKGE